MAAPMFGSFLRDNMLLAQCVVLIMAIMIVGPSLMMTS
jgi:hypothetical protein